MFRPVPRRGRRRPSSRHRTFPRPRAGIAARHTARIAGVALRRGRVPGAQATAAGARGETNQERAEPHHGSVGMPRRARNVFRARCVLHFTARAADTLAGITRLVQSVGDWRLDDYRSEGRDGLVGDATRRHVHVAARVRGGPCCGGQGEFSRSASLAGLRPSSRNRRGRPRWLWIGAASSLRRFHQARHPQKLRSGSRTTAARRRPRS